MSSIEPGELGIFLAIARHRSFRRAADELGRTPSAVTHALRTLETRLGVRLFHRTTRSVALTELGQRLYARVAPAFRDIHDALDDLDQMRGRPFGTLRFNAARTSAHLALLPRVTRFLACHPDMRVDVVVDNHLVDTVAEGFDAGVRFGEIIAQDMIAVPIGSRQRSAVVATPDFFRRHPRPEHPRQLRDMPCIRLRFGSGRLYAWEFERDGVELEVEVDGPLTVDDQMLMLDAALDGAGLAYVFEDQVRSLLQQGRLLRVLDDWCPHYGGFYLYYPGRRHVPATLRAFVDFLRAGDASPYRPER